MFRYILHSDGSYQHLDERTGELLFTIGPPPLTAVGFSWDGKHSVMHKHGLPGSVKAWRKRYSDIYRAAGVDEELYTITGELDTTDLNRIIDTTSYLDLYLRNSGCLEAMDEHPDCRNFELFSKDGWTGWAPAET